MAFNPGTNTFRIRFSIASQGQDNANAGTYALYVSKNGGGYTQVTTSSTNGVKTTAAASSDPSGTRIKIQRLTSGI